MLYTPQMLFDFAAENGIEVKTLCKSRNGRDIPCFEFGSGERHIVLTSRHHACEATGSYVLEGLLCDLHNNPETCYFGERDNIFSQEKAKELGKCFALALRRYINE